MFSNKEVLIDKDVCINVVRNSMNNTNINNAKIESLHLLLELQIHHSPTLLKELVLQVTDETDPLLLFTTIVTESNYQNLRSSQGLLVDFESFPHHFSDLIKKCLEEQRTELPKFILVLRMSGHDPPSLSEDTAGKVVFEVLELNSFKHLCHLSLNLLPATTHAKMHHLANCIKALKMRLGSEREKASQTEALLAEEAKCLRNKLSAATKEMECMEREMQVKMSREMEKHSNVLMQEKELNLKTKSDCDRKLSREKRDLEARFHTQISDLKSSNLALKNANHELGSKNTKLESALKDAKQRLKDVEEKCSRQSHDLNVMAKERADLRRDNTAKEDSIQQLKSQIAQQEKDMDEMDRIIKRNSDTLENFHREKVCYRENLDLMRAKLEKREESVRKLFLDFQKSLEIIKKFKQKIKEEEAEISSLANEAVLRSRVLEERESELKKLRGEKEDLTKRLLALEAESRGTTARLTEAAEKLRTQQDLLAKNENVISWLNKQLHEMEKTEAILRKAPLAEAYINSQTVPPKDTCSPPLPCFAISTPSSALAEPPNFVSSAQSKMSCIPRSKDMADIPEEATPPSAEHDKENDSPGGGLEAKYLEPSAAKHPPLPVRGILRANADRPHRTHKQRAPSKQSAYFKKN